MRIIIVGMGSIGIRHARICKERFPQWSVELCDSRPEGLLEACEALGSLPQVGGASHQSGVRPPGGAKASCLTVWENWGAALASRPQAILLATPHTLHARMACEAMEAGLPVLCEKPMSHDVQSALLMAKTAKRTGSLLRIGFMLRFQPAVVHLRSLLERGELGQLLSFRYHIGSHITLENSRSRYQERMPGALVMDYVHGLDLLFWLTGHHPIGVYAQGRTAGNFPLGAHPNLFAALLDFETPLLAEVHMDYACKPQLHELLLTGEKATVRLELSRGEMEIRHREENRTEQLPFTFAIDDLYTRQLEAFFAAREGHPSPGCGPEEGVLSTCLMERLLESARLGRRIGFHDPTFQGEDHLHP